MEWTEPYVETQSGKLVHFLNPQEGEIDIEDIAYSLANQCRFNGHGGGFFSVAEHSVGVALRLPSHLQLAGLLHDASEAYLADLPSPVKTHIGIEYSDIERNLQDHIYRNFDCLNSYATHHIQVKSADMAALRTEAHYLMKSQGLHWFGGSKEWHDIRINEELQPRCLPPQHAFHLFMDMYKHLTKPKIQLA